MLHWDDCCLKELGEMPEGLPLLMDRAYEGDQTGQHVLDMGMIPVVPPKSNRLNPWQYNRQLYKKSNEVKDFSGDSKDFAASSHASKNWTSSSSHSFTSP